MSGGAGPLVVIEPGYGKGLNIAVVAAEWHQEVVDGLVGGAMRVLEQAQANIQLIRVPGSFELPVATLRALETGADAAVALGVVIQGGTPHFEYVCQGATNGLTQVAIKTGKAVGFGLLTVDDEEQALDRCGLPTSREDKGAEAAQAALVTTRRLLALAEL